MWATQVGLTGASDAESSAATLEPWVLDPDDPENTVSTIAAHVSLVGRVCATAASGLAFV